MKSRRFEFVLGALAVIGLNGSALAFHGGGHGGGGHGGGGFHGGGAHYGGYHPAGGYHAAAPAFNRTPSFSTPRAFAQPYAGAGAMHPGAVVGNRGIAQPGFGRLGEPGARVGNVNVNRGGFNNAGVNQLAGRPGIGWNNRYMGYHQNWVHGYWNGHHPGGWGWRGGYGYPGFGYWGGYGGGLGYNGFGWGLGSGLGMGLGMGMGYGLSSWLFGPMLYNWGYSNYMNPYYGGGGYGGTTVVQQPIVYDYAQPINATAPPPDEGVSNQALSAFDQAREVFRQGDYTQALSLTDQALRQMPNDPTLHEFRALALFALGRYDEAAAALYAVLSVGPGWDWTTLISLYGNPDAYTQQLRALESYTDQHKTSAASRFVLAYHYLTEGHMTEAADQLREVSILQPKDQLSAQLLRQIQQAQQSAPAGSGEGANPSASPGAGPGPLASSTAPGPNPTPAQSPAPASAGQQGSIVGTWMAHPSQDTTITVTFPDAAHFTWRVVQKGQDHQFEGASSYVNGILTLAQDQNNAMVGDVNWQDPNHFQFKVLGGGPEDPGLTFAKSS